MIGLYIKVTITTLGENVTHLGVLSMTPAAFGRITDKDINNFASLFVTNCMKRTPNATGCNYEFISADEYQRLVIESNPNLNSITHD